jgi:hypothetical protein
LARHTKECSQKESFNYFFVEIFASIQHNGAAHTGNERKETTTHNNKNKNGNHDSASATLKKFSVVDELKNFSNFLFPSESFKLCKHTHTDTENFLVDLWKFQLAKVCRQQLQAHLGVNENPHDSLLDPFSSSMTVSGKNELVQAANDKDENEIAHSMRPAIHGSFCVFFFAQRNISFLLPFLLLLFAVYQQTLLKGRENIENFFLSHFPLLVDCEKMHFLVY